VEKEGGNLLSVLKKVSWVIFPIFIAFSAIANESKTEKYFIVHFETGPNWDKSLKPQEQSQFREHSQNLNRLRKEKVIVFGARYSELGAIILKADSLNKVTAIISDDPGVKSGIFIFKVEPLYIFYPWET